MQRGRKPYIKLGERLHEIRRGLKESLGEVSGAVELDKDIIDSYEKGETRPSEDVLNLLISHFDIKDEDADELWELAGYVESSEQPHGMPSDLTQVPTVVVVPMDTKIVYTDKVNVTANDHGLVMNFVQDSPTGQSVPVSRVGMSIEHAKKVIEVMAKTINQAESHGKPKQLPDKSKDSPK